MNCLDNREISVTTIDWQGITLSVSYEADWLGMGERMSVVIAHLQVQSLAPEKAPLPITETGYRSHFLPARICEQQGGPVAFARQWLDEEAKSATWRQHLAGVAQLSLF